MAAPAIAVSVLPDVISCYRVVLAAGSEHFRAMFTRSFSESRAREIELHEITPEGFQVL